MNRFQTRLYRYLQSGTKPHIEESNVDIAYNLGVSVAYIKVTLRYLKAQGLIKIALSKMKYPWGWKTRRYIYVQEIQTQ